MTVRRLCGQECDPHQGFEQNLLLFLSPTSPPSLQMAHLLGIRMVQNFLKRNLEKRQLELFVDHGRTPSLRFLKFHLPHHPRLKINREARLWTLLVLSISRVSTSIRCRQNSFAVRCDPAISSLKN
jgi:hypothetical protein